MRGLEFVDIESVRVHHFNNYRERRQRRKVPQVPFFGTWVLGGCFFPRRNQISGAGDGNRTRSEKRIQTQDPGTKRRNLGHAAGFRQDDPMGVTENSE